uniref:Uncharacterized protein n=1 Tax=Anguilla anguilla TaxID=7936 RepID=A0A0E9RKU2_ANGAN
MTYFTSKEMFTSFFVHNFDKIGTSVSHSFKHTDERNRVA